MNYLQPGQLRLQTWQKTFFNQPFKAQSFIESMNAKGVPNGMLPLTKTVIGDFSASYVLVDWNDEPVAHAAHKKNVKQSNKLSVNPCIAVIGSLCCTRYHGYKLSQYPLQAALFAAKNSGAEWLEANCNQSSIGLFLALGFLPVGETIDGKTKVSAHHSQLLVSEPPEIVAIKLPTFVDGGIYD